MYIGETGRNLKKRLKEHAVKKKNLKNGIAAPACQQQHSVDWDAAKVRCTEQHYWKTKVHEAIHINQQSYTFNLDCGLQINPVWPLFNRKSLVMRSCINLFNFHSYSSLLYSILCSLFCLHARFTFLIFSPHPPPCLFICTQNVYLSRWCFQSC